MTGASGTVYARRLLSVLARDGHDVHLVVSEAARTVLLKEESIEVDAVPDVRTLVSDLRDADPLDPKALARITAHHPDDIAAPVASGSVPADGVAVVPCSMSTLGAIASGSGRNLIHRAADVALKEGTRLVLAPRETPLSAIQLENMARLAGLGVRIVPCMPAFYLKPKTVMDLVDFVVDRICAQLGVTANLAGRWKG
jgi:4-hydroxy-3-polyprenylbenzoate decarboxylase